MPLHYYHWKGVQLLNINEYRDDGALVDVYLKAHFVMCCQTYCTIKVIFFCFHTVNVNAVIKAYIYHP